MKKAVIFDLDGTLWDAGEPIAKSWTEALHANGVDLTVTEARIKSLMGKPMEAIMEALVPDIDEKTRLGLLKDCCRHEEEILRAQGGILFDGLHQMLTQLRREGYHLSIISNCQDGYIETFLDYHKMHSFFDDYECPGRTGVLKADNIRLVMERNQIDRAVYVGDTQGDLDASRKAGVPFIYARYGFGSVDDETYAADGLLELPAQVEKVYAQCLSAFAPKYSSYHTRNI